MLQKKPSAPLIEERLEKNLNSFFLSNSAYPHSSSGSMLKLDAMEMQLPLPNDLEKDWIANLGYDLQTARYPEDSQQILKGNLAKIWQIPPTHDWIFGNGSDEILFLLLQSMIGNKNPVLFLEPSFSMYKRIADSLSVPYEVVNLDEDFKVNGGNILNAIHTLQPPLIILANPNNPTGQSIRLDLLEKICQESHGLVVIDEAYFAFAATNAWSLLQKYPFVMIVRTLSKIGLASLRVGMATAHASWIRVLDGIRLPYNISELNQKALCIALQHYPKLISLANEIVNNRFHLQQKLLHPQWRVFPSEANFILVQEYTKSHERACAMHAHLLQHSILVKLLSTPHSPLAGCLRITVGTKEQNAFLLEVWNNFLVAS